ncbi:hypothetical protein BU23DRAFT_577327 [Bimuria novae-zelandiae CBS 107.79]|uniref:Cyclin-D1-binding protein 1-like N-terminal domain-containing protein n=1 Tax=Bimuria novae-zelandiae CBS 107.79 TaxID=1447943 RepID=A0A6A5VPG6_9PLEO|nr:hypothetical protein BU23DRAFT_577327 [Bimuria novae-zelandiae CBS 107.79]
MAKPTSLAALNDLAKTTKTLLAHFQSSLAPTNASDPSIPPPPKPLDAVKACATLLKSHTTSLSLLLITPPFTPSAIMTKIGDVSSGPLTGLVGAAVAENSLGALMQVEVRAQARQLIGSWGEVVGLVGRMAERRQTAQTNGSGSAKEKAKDEGPSKAEKDDVLAATGVVWESCDALVKLCDGGIAGLVVKKAEELRSTLLDAVEELKEWGEDVDDDENEAEDSNDGFEDEDDIFGAANKLGKGDKELKEALDKSVKKIKMVGVLYQALIKRRLKTFPTPAAAAAKTNGEASQNSTATLEELVKLLRSIPEQVDDLAGAFYNLDGDEAKATLGKCCGQAKSAAGLVKQNWAGADDEFTAWSMKWVDALDKAE